IVVRAIGKLGDSKFVDTLLPLVSNGEREVRIEAIQAAAKLVDPRRVEHLRAELQNQAASPDQTIARMAASAMTELDNRIGSVAPTTGPTPVLGTGTGHPPAPQTLRPPLPQAEQAKTMLMSESAV